MRKLLNTLFVTTQGAYLSKEGETVVVSVERAVRLRLPLLTLGGIVGFGNVACSPFLLGACAEKGILVSFLTEHGRFLARVCGPEASPPACCCTPRPCSWPAACAAISMPIRRSSGAEAPPARRP